MDGDWRLAVAVAAWESVPPISPNFRPFVAISSDNNERERAREGKVGLQISHGTVSAGERKEGRKGGKGVKRI